MDRRDCTSASAWAGVGIGREEAPRVGWLDESVLFSLRVNSLPMMIVPKNETIATERDWGEECPASIVLFELSIGSCNAL